MKGDKTVLKNLQTALTMELTAVHQYLLHRHVLDDWGLGRLAAKMGEEMTEEMGHAGRFISRMMFLEGEPDAQKVQTVARAQTLQDMFDADLKDEYEARKFYAKAAGEARQSGDIGSATLFEEIALEEEGHIDWLEGQIRLLEKMGEPGFYQLYADPDGEGAAA